MKNVAIFGAGRIGRIHAGVKIIHGYGASTGMSVIREQAVRLIMSPALRNGGKLVQDRNNPGAHIP